MSRATLVRFGAIAAIGGGVLRAAGSFAARAGTDTQLQVLYLVIDIFLLLGVLGFYELRHESVGRTGACGFLVALVGIAVIRSGRSLPGIDLYPAGALTFVVGLLILCVTAWRTKGLAAWVPVMLVLSTLAGFLGTAIPSAGALFVLSGVMFGAAFAGLGREAWVAAGRL